jgi:hypothetical protein
VHFQSRKNPYGSENVCVIQKGLAVDEAVIRAGAIIPQRHTSSIRQEGPLSIINYRMMHRDWELRRFGAELASFSRARQRNGFAWVGYLGGVYETGLREPRSARGELGCGLA